jgi:hypothetical protein
MGIISVKPMASLGLGLSLVLWFIISINPRARVRVS